MRTLPVLPLILLTLLAAPGGVGRAAPPAAAGAPGGTVGPAAVSAGPANAGARGGIRGPSAPTGNFSGAGRGVGIAAPPGGGNFRGPAGPVGGVRYAPITAGARPVGTVNVPRPLPNRAMFPATRPNVAAGAVNVPGRVPAARPYNYPAATNSAVPSGRLSAFTATSAARNDRTGNGTAIRPRPDRSRQPGAYQYYYPGTRGRYGPLPGHYVPGESYVLDPGIGPNGYAFAAGPPYYLGGAFPYFYGGSIGGTGAYYGQNADLIAPEAASAPEAPATAPAPTPGPGAAVPAPDEPATAATPAPPGPLSGPNSLVEAVQVELVRRGYFGGRPDGVFGVDTGEALRRFQENHGLATSGMINEATLFALGLN